MELDALYSSIKSARRKRLLWGFTQLYAPIASNTEEGLRKLELDGGYEFPIAVRSALLALGGCSVDDLYIHPAERIYSFDSENGAMAGRVTFASDIFGNYFAFDPASNNPDEIYYYSHDPLGYALVSPTFTDYLRSFVSSGFKTLELTENLDLREP